MQHFTLKSRFALLLAILIAPFAGVSAAGLIDASGAAAAATHATANVDSALDANLYSNGSASTTNSGSQGALNANVNADINANSNSRVSNQAGSATDNQNATATEHANVNALENASGQSAITSYTRDSADIMTTVSPEMVAGNVETESDLKSFAATSLRNDDNLSSVGFASDKVEVAYREPARFLGFIPSSINVDVIAHQDGTVDMSYPWYSFLMITDRSGLESSIQNEIGAYMSQHHASATALLNANEHSALNASTTATSSVATSTSSTAGNASWSASLRAELAARIMAVLRSHLESSSTASSTQSSY